MAHVISIIRDRQETNGGTFGRMFYDGDLFCVTVERGWRSNEKSVSCIPPGEYELVPFNSARFGSVVAFRNPALGVWVNESDIPKGLAGRSACLIHAANWPHELHGCVAVGREVKDIPPHGMGVTSSRPTLNKLRNLWNMRRDLVAKITYKGG